MTTQTIPMMDPASFGAHESCELTVAVDVPVEA